MQAARVVSGSLVTDIDMAGAPGLLALALPPHRPPPTSSVGSPPHTHTHPPFSTPSRPLIYFLLFLCRLSSTLTPSPSPPGLPLPAHCLPPITQPAPPAHLPTSPPLSPRSWELLAPPSKERPLSGPVQDGTEQGGVLQHRPPEHLVDRGGRK